MITSQRHLFNIPDEVAYLNTAYMSPLLNSVVDAMENGVKLKSCPWKIKIEDGGEIASSEGVLVESEFSSHELLELEKFKLNPVQETVYSFSALVGCFFLVLVIPLMIFFSARYRENMNEKLRATVEEE